MKIQTRNAFEEGHIHTAVLFMFTEYGVILKRGIQVLCGRVRTRERCHGRREHPLALHRYRCKYNKYISKTIDSGTKVVQLKPRAHNVLDMF